MRPGPLFPNADTINFDEQLPAIIVHRRMHLQIRCQSCDEFRKSLSVVVHLQRDNSFVVLGWIVDDIAEVAVQGQQNGVDFLGLRDGRPCPMIARVEHLSSVRPHGLLLVWFGWLSSRRSGQPRTAGPSDDGLKFGQFSGIVQTCGDLVQ